MWDLNVLLKTGNNIDITIILFINYIYIVRYFPTSLFLFDSYLISEIILKYIKVLLHTTYTYIKIKYLITIILMNNDDDFHNT